MHWLDDSECRWEHGGCQNHIPTSGLNKGFLSKTGEGSTITEKNRVKTRKSIRRSRVTLQIIAEQYAWTLLLTWLAFSVDLKFVCSCCRRLPVVLTVVCTWLCRQWCITPDCWKALRRATDSAPSLRWAFYRRPNASNNWPICATVTRKRTCAKRLQTYFFRLVSRK